MGNSQNSSSADTAKRRQSKVYVSFLDLAMGTSGKSINMAQPMTPEMRADLLKQCETFCQASRRDNQRDKYSDARPQRRARSSPA